MPTLNWLTREADLQKSRRAPYRLIEPVSEMGYGDPAAENLLIQGDNLEHSRHLVFALPKVFRSAFRHRRRLLPNRPSADGRRSLRCPRASASARAFMRRLSTDCSIVLP